jgi:hypothetical protein
MTQEKFLEVLDEKGYSYKIEDEKLIVDFNEDVWLDSLKEIPNNVVFKNGGSVNLDSLKEIPNNVVFKNGGSVWLNSLKEIPNNVVFKNGGSVYLDSLKELPSGVVFKNGSIVFLNSLEKLPSDVVFKNGGSVYLTKIKGKVNYQGRELDLKTIDGYTMIIDSKKERGEYTIYKARYFQGGKYEDMKQCFIAQNAKYFAHGSSLKKAIEDVGFKFLQENLNVDELVESIKEKGVVTIEDYRLLTGACRAGVDHFLESKDIKDDSLPLEKVFSLVKGAYGGEKFRELLG